MTNATIKINGVNFEALNADKKAALAAIFGVDVNSLSFSTPKKKETNNLQMKDGSETIAIDKFSGEEFDITQLSEEELANAKKTGLSPMTYAKMLEGEAIKKSMGKIRTVRTGISAAKQVHTIVEKYSDQINESVMLNLTNKDFSKKMSLAYPLFKEIPNDASEEIRKEIRMDGKHARFSPRVWTFEQLPGRKFFMTNNIFANNVPKVEAILTSLLK